MLWIDEERRTSMKIVRFSYNENTAFGILIQDDIVPLAAFGVPEQKTLTELAAFDAEFGLETYVTAAPESVWSQAIPLTEVVLRAPVDRPPHDVICVGVNYQEHRKESEKAAAQLPEKIVFFGKRCGHMTGPGETVALDPAIDAAMDYETELAVILRRGGRNIPRDAAEECIFGYSIFNDFTARAVQAERGQWYLGKSIEGYSAMGPCVLHRSSAASPARFSLSCRVNGELRQSADTSQFLANIGDLIADVSRYITLEPGDIIATGTPGGVGFSYKPPRFLHHGDTVVCEISDIGILENHIKEI